MKTLISMFALALRARYFGPCLRRRRDDRENPGRLRESRRFVGCRHQLVLREEDVVVVFLCCIEGAPALAGVLFCP